MVDNQTWTLADTGLTQEEYDVLNLLSFEILSDEDYRHKWYELTNAFHLIQGVFMQRALVRMTQGKYWIKFDLPYENHETLLPLPDQENKYFELARNLHKIHTEFQKLERFHPSNLDDITRGVNGIIRLLR